MKPRATLWLNYGFEPDSDIGPKCAKIAIVSGLMAALWFVGANYAWPRINAEVRRTRAALQRPAAFHAATQISFAPGSVAFRSHDPVRHYETLRPLYQLRNLDEQLSRSVRCVRGGGYRRPQPPAPDWEAHASTVFAHGRRNGGGPERLVVVMFDWELFQNAHPTPFRVHVESWNGRYKPMHVTRSVDAYGFQFKAPATLPPTLYGGQHDPLDESHFTIDYDTPAGSGTIDGWLQSDDTVRMQVRSGPAASQVPR